LSNGTEANKTDWPAPDYWNIAPTPYKENEDLKYAFIGDVLIYEPCNYASNIAYYHSVTRACDWAWKVQNGYPK